MDIEKEIERCKKRYFSEHEIKVIENTPNIKKFRFSKPGTGCYGFHLTTSDNMILLSGDIYSLYAEPGYGRDGLVFLRGSIKSRGYFLEKVPYHFKDALKEFSTEEAKAELKRFLEEGYIDQDGYNTMMRELSYIDDYSGDKAREFMFHKAFYEELGYSDHFPDPMILNGRTIVQLAGLEAFVEKYEALNEVG